jgi:hypothetical protein
MIVRILSVESHLEPPETHNTHDHAYYARRATEMSELLSVVRTIVRLAAGAVLRFEVQQLGADAELGRGPHHWVNVCIDDPDDRHRIGSTGSDSRPHLVEPLGTMSKVALDGR